jgi:hypothetical protein
MVGFNAADMALIIAEEDVARAVPIPADRKTASTALEALGRIVAKGLLYPEAPVHVMGLRFNHFVHPRTQLLGLVFEPLSELKVRP